MGGARGISGGHREDRVPSVSSATRHPNRLRTVIFARDAKKAQSCPSTSPTRCLLWLFAFVSAGSCSTRSRQFHLLSRSDVTHCGGLSCSLFSLKCDDAQRKVADALWLCDAFRSGFEIGAELALGKSSRFVNKVRSIADQLHSHDVP